MSNAPATLADPFEGWKLRGCEGVVKAGVLTVTEKSKTPFLAFGARKFAGSTVVKFRIRSTTGGAGKMEWLTSSQQSEQAKSVPFVVTGGDWQEQTVNLPATGSLGIVRLYLPADTAPVQLDWVELKSAGGDSQRWDF
jgi:hypothetical protein